MYIIRTAYITAQGSSCKQKVYSWLYFKTGDLIESMLIYIRNTLCNPINALQRICDLCLYRWKLHGLALCHAPTHTFIYMFPSVSWISISFGIFVHGSYTNAISACLVKSKIWLIVRSQALYNQVCLHVTPRCHVTHACATVYIMVVYWGRLPKCRNDARFVLK